MSYCRFSSNNFWCDVYVYKNVNGGWTTHVAANRHVIPPIPQLPWRWMPKLGVIYDEGRVIYPSRFHAAVADVCLSVLGASNRLHLWSVRVIPRRKIGGPYDGARLHIEEESGPAEVAGQLEALRDWGYKVPQYAIDALLEEAFSQ